MARSIRKSFAASAAASNNSGVLGERSNAISDNSSRPFNHPAVNRISDFKSRQGLSSTSTDFVMSRTKTTLSTTSEPIEPADSKFSETRNESLTTINIASSARQKFQALEKERESLSDQEYKERKKAILDSI